MRLAKFILVGLMATAAQADPLKLEIEYPAGTFTAATPSHDLAIPERINAPLDHELTIEAGKPYAVWMNRPEGTPIGFCDEIGKENKEFGFKLSPSAIYTNDFFVQCMEPPISTVTITGIGLLLHKGNNYPMLGVLVK